MIVPKGTQLSKATIEEALEYHAKELPKLKRLGNYYKGIQDILDRVKFNETLKNRKIVINHAKDIVDTTVGYFIGQPVEYQAKEGLKIDPLLEQYKMQSISNHDLRISKKISIYGKSFEYTYANEENRLITKTVECTNAIVAYDDTIEHKPVFGVMYTKQRNKTGQFIAVDTEKIIEGTISKEGTISMGIETSHAFEALPLLEFINNDEKQGDFEQVMELMDAYNILQSDRVNDKEQLIEAILLVYGFDLTPKQAKRAKKEKMITAIPADGKVEYLVNRINETESEVLRKTLEDDIYKISATPNFADENFAGNSSGVAIAYKLLKFEQRVKIKEVGFEEGLMERFKLYNTYLSKMRKMSEVPTYEVDAVFKRTLPANVYELAQTISLLKDLVDDETLIAQLPFIDDASEVVEKVRSERVTSANIEVPNFGSSTPSE